ncbi:MAG: glycosyl transferase [Armatimonadota bacterium]|nr:MAG: glycosyl transferase [Armatimonadota bacterium]
MSPDVSTVPDISVSVVNWNTRSDLLECLSSIIPRECRHLPSGCVFQSGGVFCDVTVVDNNSQDFSADAVQNIFPVVRLLRMDRNLGFAAGHNRAFAAARGRYRFVLNPDATVSAGCLKALLDFAEAHPRAAVIGPRVLNPDGSIQHSARAFPTLMAALYRHSLLGKLFPDNPHTRRYLQSDWDHRDSRQVDWVSGSAMLIREEAVRELGGFDERYYMYVEDVDLCWRARQAGWEVWFCADAEVTHKKARASDLMPNRMIYHHHRSMYIFYRTHYRPRAGVLERVITPPGLVLRAAYFIGRNKLHGWLRKGE